MVPFLLLLLFVNLGEAALYTKAYPWPNNTVYYVFDTQANFTTLDKDRLRQALDVISNNTCIEFIEGPTTKHHIKIYSGKGNCGSPSGFTNPFNDTKITHQGMNLPPGCISTIETPIHEMLHALGLVHTNVRTDRDDYIIVHFELMDNATKEANKVGETTNPTPYDYNSFMHPTSHADSNLQNPLFEPKDQRYNKTLGSHQGSFYDFDAVNQFHKCYDKCSPATSVNCTNGGIPHPKDCQKCLCPSGFGGKHCNERPGICGETFDLTSGPKSVNLTIGIVNVTGAYAKEKCVYWFRAPPGYKILLLFQGTQHPGVEAPKPAVNCGNYGWEFKVKEDPRAGGPIFCDDIDKNVTLLSHLNPAPLTLYSNGNVQVFSFLVQAVKAVPTITHTTTN